VSKTKLKPEARTLQERVAARQAELNLNPDGTPKVATADPPNASDTGPSDETVAEDGDAHATDDGIPDTLAAGAPIITTTDPADPDHAPPAPAAAPPTPFVPAGVLPDKWFVPERAGLLEKPFEVRQRGRFTEVRLELRRVSDPTIAASRNAAAQELTDAVLADGRRLEEVRHFAFLLSERNRTAGGVALARARSDELAARQQVLKLSREPDLGRRLVEITQEIQEHVAAQKRLQEEADQVGPLLDAARAKAEAALVLVAERHAVMSRSWLTGKRAEALTEIASLVGNAINKLIAVSQQLQFWYDANAIARQARGLIERAADFEPEPTPPTPAAAADSPTDPPVGDVAWAPAVAEVASDALAVATPEAVLATPAA